MFKIATFSKFFGDFMTHIIRENAGKRIKKFWFFFQLKILDTLLSLFQVPQSLQMNFSFFSNLALFDRYILILEDCDKKILLFKRLQLIDFVATGSGQR